MKGLPVECFLDLPVVRFRLAGQSKTCITFFNSTTQCNMSTKQLRTGDAKPPVQPDLVRVYSFKYSPFVERVLIMLTAKGISYEIVECHLLKKPEFLLELNPRGKVPVLEYKGHAVSESLVICELLEDLFPDKPIRSADPYQRAQDRLTAAVFEKTIELFYKSHFNRNDKEAMDGFNKSLDSFETHFKEKKTDFFSGSQWGFADIMVWPWFERFPGLLGDTMDRLPALAAWTARMAAIPVAQSCAIPKDEMLEFYKQMFGGNLDVMDF